MARRSVAVEGDGKDIAKARHKAKVSEAKVKP